MISDTRRAASALGGEVVGRDEILCPGPGHGPRDRSLSVRISASSPDGFMTHSFAGDGWRECRDHVRRLFGIERERGPAPRAAVEALRRAPDPKPQDDERRARDLSTAAALVAAMRPVRGTPGESYLREVRHIDTSAVADVLERTDAIGWHPAVYFNEPDHPMHGRRLGCIVGVMTDVKTAQPSGAISRTYLSPDGTKVGKAKTLGAPTGIARLSPDDEVLGGLFLAEGFETALTAMALGLRPTWATGGTAEMARFPVPPGIECLTIIADHDPRGGGEKAARAVEATWRKAGREVRIFRSEQIGDLNDTIGRAS